MYVGSGILNFNENSDPTTDLALDGRAGRMIASTLLLVWVIYCVVVASRGQSISPLYGIAAILIYVVLSGGLMAWIASRLYRQHGVRQFKFDVANMILLSVLISLPLAVSNAFWEIFKVQEIAGMKDDKTLFFLLVTAVAGFFLFPILMLTEGVLSWWSRRLRTTDD